MKKLDFMSSLNHLSDKTVAEAAEARETGPAAKKSRTWIKYAAAAACVGIVAAAGIGVSRSVDIERKRPDSTEVTYESTGIYEPGEPVPVLVDGLPRIAMPQDYSENGGRGVFLKNGTEDLRGAEPLSAEDIPEKLPVYKSPIYPDRVDVDKIRGNLDTCAKAWGLDPSALDVADGVYQTLKMSAESGGISISASQYGAEVTVGADLPELDGEDGLAEYILKNYADRLMLGDPAVSIDGGERDADGEQHFTVSFYEGGGGAVGQFINKELRSVTVTRGEDGSLTFSYSLRDAESLGDYPTVSEEEAIELFEQGFYAGASDGDVRDRENIEKIELSYDLGGEYWYPCYKIWVYDPNGAIERVMDMKLYNVYCVPAIEPRYFAESGLSTEEEPEYMPFNASDIPEYRKLGCYDSVVRDVTVTSANESLEEIFGSGFDNAQIGSLYKLRISGIVSDGDKIWLNGYDGISGDADAVFYRAAVLYDYLAEKPMQKDIIFSMTGSFEIQSEGSPPFSEGDTVALMLYRDSEKTDFNRAFKSNAFVYDIAKIDGAEYFLARGQRVPGLEDGLTDYLRDDSASIVTSTTINPAVYHGAYDPTELSEKLGKIIDSAEKDSLETLVENKFGPGSLAHGMSADEKAIEVAALEYSSEPVYERIHPVDTVPMTGIPESLDEVLNEMSGRLSGIAYEITYVYSREEAENLHEEFADDIYSIRTLYRAHAFYDVLNDRPLDYYFDVAGWGTEDTQEDGYPPYAVGDRLLSFFNDGDSEIKVPKSKLLEFMLFCLKGTDSDGGETDVKIAYHIDSLRTRFESPAYPNLDLEMTESEREVITTTKNNPIRFTQKSTLRSLSDFMRTELYNRGLFVPDSEGASLPTFRVTGETLSLGDEIYSAGSAENLDTGNPWRQLDISEGDTLPVYERVMSRNLEQNGMIENVDREFMREALRFYAIGFGFDPDGIEIEDNGITPEELEELSEKVGEDLSEEYCLPTEMSFEKDGIRVSVRVTDALLYRADISIDAGFDLPEGARVGFYFGVAREEAENAKADLLMKYEWLIGNNDAGAASVNGTQSGNCFVTMYHPCVGELIPYDDGTLPEVDRNDIVKTIINFSLNSIDFMDDGTIICYGVPGAFEKQYRKIGDYPAITPEEALRLLDSGGYVWTAFDETGKTSADVEYVELVYGTDGVPYYKLYCSAAGWRGCVEGDYGVYYVPAVKPEYYEMEE